MRRRAVTIAVASGKGGTGKTTVAVHLALAFARARQTVLVDLDVEAPDALGYFPEARPRGAPQPVRIAVPRLSSALCTGCGLCAKVCRFGAIVAVGGAVAIEDAACKGCGRCIEACPAGALSEAEIEVGTVSRHQAGPLAIVEGRTAVGDIRSTAVIEAAKKTTADIGSLRIRDCPPGVSCPAVHALEGADYAVLVAEPTAYSLHDLKAAVRLVQDLNMPAGILVNKSGFGTAEVDSFAASYGMPVLGRIDFTASRARTGAGGRIWHGDPIASEAFDRLARHILGLFPTGGAA